jgi:hypothetical protein
LKCREENYQFVGDLQRRNLIVPVTGDFGGAKSIRAVGQYLRDHGGIVTTFGFVVLAIMV